MPESAAPQPTTAREPAHPAGSEREALAGLVERVTFHTPENGFCVLRVKVRGRRDLVTVAAIDRLVHHATILEMNVDSYRRRAAVGRKDHEAVAAAATSADVLADDQDGADRTGNTSAAAAGGPASEVVGTGRRA